MGATQRSPSTPQAALVGRVTARTASLAFAVALLASLALGATLGTAIVRAAVVALAAFLVAPLLAWPVVAVVLDVAGRAVIDAEQRRKAGDRRG
ncbi:MAG: hypothetical protein IPM29_27970 [Planctomycetes bacterium]|nr:hypothetical protein [Planctomycetota bacterium]